MKRFLPGSIIPYLVCLHALLFKADEIEHLRLEQRLELLATISSLQNPQQDPKPLLDLSERIVLTDQFPFQSLVKLDLPLAQHLTQEYPPLQLTTLKFLEKAKDSIADVNWIASDRELVQALIHLWLRSEETEVASLAEDVIVRLLARGDLFICDLNLDATRAENALWRRIFKDKDIYASVMASCSLPSGGSRNAVTTAQGRLLSFLLKVRAGPAWLTQFEDVQAKYGQPGDPWGLLSFAIGNMVDLEDDLMVPILIDFCKDLISRPTYSLVNGMTSYHSDESIALEVDILRMYGRHEWCLNHYLSASTASWVVPHSAEYISTFAQHFPKLLLSSPQFKLIVQRLETSFSRSLRAWADVPSNDLLILPSLPQKSLRSGRDTLINFIPPVNQPLVIYALSQCFRGGVASRMSYFLYLNKHPDLWSRIIEMCETISLLDSALAAHSFINSIATANWSPLPDTEEGDFPTEAWLNDICSTAPTGIEALMMPGVEELLIPYLLRPPIMFGGGDEASSAWQVARAKHDVLQVIYQKATLPEEISSRMEERIRAGPLSGDSRVGGEIGTMEK